MSLALFNPPLDTLHPMLQEIRMTPAMVMSKISRYVIHVAAPCRDAEKFKDDQRRRRRAARTEWERARRARWHAAGLNSAGKTYHNCHRPELEGLTGKAYNAAYKKLMRAHKKSGCPCQNPPPKDHA